MVWCMVFLSGFWVLRASGQEKDGKTAESSWKHSKPVHVGGVEFEVVAEVDWKRPTKVYGVAQAKIGLRITNRSDKDLTFDLGDALLVSLKSGDASDLVSGPVPRRFLPKPLKVGAGKSETVTLPTHLFHTRIGHVCLGLESDVGWNWLTGDVLPGKYRLCLSYENKQKGDDAWVGKMQTHTLEIEVKAVR